MIRIEVSFLTSNKLESVKCLSSECLYSENKEQQRNAGQCFILNTKLISYMHVKRRLITKMIILKKYKMSEMSCFPLFDTVCVSFYLIQPVSLFI